MSPYRSGPRSVSFALARIESELAPQTLLAEVQSRWAQAVGEVNAAEAQPTAERGGVLTVSCAASVWAQELDLMAPVILPALNAVLRRGEIVRLRCVTLPPRDLTDRC